MSELINIRDSRATIRWKLLTGASALALTAYISSANVAKAEDSDRPQVWIELGGQLSRLSDKEETFAPSLFDVRPAMFSPSQKFETPPLYSIGEFAKILFQPEGSDWSFAASIRYGRSVSDKHVHQQTYPEPFVKYISGVPGTGAAVRRAHAAKFADTAARNSEQYTILDFEAGKDIGLGMLGNKEWSSTVNLGVRFAQFKSHSNVAIKSDPDWHFSYKYLPPSYPITELTNGESYHSNAASFSARRSFRGIGPSISWTASAPIAGNTQDGAITVDWGVNAALLFGKQRTQIHHQTTAQYHSHKYTPPHRTTISQTSTTPPARSRSVMVPNLGGFAGLSFRYVGAKVSIGYRADFFFNAIDGGIDARKEENRGFYGPFASVSIGLGD